MSRLSIFAVCLLACFLSACGSVPTTPESVRAASSRPHGSVLGREVSLYALGLIDTGYRFGGKNPEAGLDCSGMVSYVFRQAAGIRLSGSAADIARRGRPVNRRDLRPGDLVFFNTRGAPFSHVGVFIGDGRFVHAPSTNGRVRIDRMNAPYYTSRFHAARAYFD
jgi:cell wall-associated NlpC family hydrolase